MKILNTTRDQIEKAMKATNKKFKGNVCLCFKRSPEALNRKGTSFSLTLTVFESKGPGARRGFQRNKDGERRRIQAACWHVFGTFYDELFWQNSKNADGVRDYVNGPKYNLVIRSSGSAPMYSPSDNWQDRQVGSMMDPVMFSELCDCED